MFGLRNGILLVLAALICFSPALAQEEGETPTLSLEDITNAANEACTCTEEDTFKSKKSGCYKATRRGTGRGMAKQLEALGLVDETVNVKDVVSALKAARKSLKNQDNCPKGNGKGKGNEGEGEEDDE